ncbi:hypothetical protein MINS_37790 [Mycolicibacterium insubricum]|uniref:hypothetical protein n=1 Tax=Mycolicibacterium insubricum TaxID=444597 RepID=UPI00138BBE8E|nr:hypothetical protein [Mycolicibacterium insubricum]BBZ68350.1 hypothetical protein MINS_37790 [Mycolicibacterium insubricum]
MSSENIVGRVGALAVALGIGGAVAAGGCGIAFADDGPTNSSDRGGHHRSEPKGPKARGTDSPDRSRLTVPRVVGTVANRDATASVDDTRVAPDPAPSGRGPGSAAGSVPSVVSRDLGSVLPAAGRSSQRTRDRFSLGDKGTGLRSVVGALREPSLRVKRAFSLPADAGITGVVESAVGSDVLDAGVPAVPEVGVARVLIPAVAPGQSSERQALGAGAPSRPADRLAGWVGRVVAEVEQKAPSVGAASLARLTAAFANPAGSQGISEIGAGTPVTLGGASAVSYQVLQDEEGEAPAGASATIVTTGASSQKPAQPIRDLLRSVLGVLGYSPDASNHSGDLPIVGQVFALAWAGYRRIESFLGNDTPTVSAQPTITTVSGDGTTVAGTLGITDVNGDALKYTATSDNGSVEVHSDGSFTVTEVDPAKPVNLAVTASDADSGFHLHGLTNLLNGGGHTVTQSYQINVTPAQVDQNQAPKIVDFWQSDPDEAGKVTGYVIVKDPDGDEVRPTLAAEPKYGAVTLDDPVATDEPGTTRFGYTYQQDPSSEIPEALATDNFSFGFADGQGGTVTTNPIEVALNTKDGAKPTGAPLIGNGVKYQPGEYTEGEHAGTTFIKITEYDGDGNATVHIVEPPAGATGDPVLNPVTGSLYQMVGSPDGATQSRVVILDKKGNFSEPIDIAGTPTGVIVFDGAGNAYVTSTADGTGSGGAPEGESNPGILRMAAFSEPEPSGPVTHVTVIDGNGNPVVTTVSGTAMGNVVIGTEGMAYQATCTGATCDQASAGHVAIFKDGNLTETVDLEGKPVTPPAPPGFPVSPVAAGPHGTAVVVTTAGEGDNASSQVYALGADGLVGTPIAIDGRPNSLQTPVFTSDGTAYISTSVGSADDTTMRVAVIGPDGTQRGTTQVIGDYPNSVFIAGDKAYALAANVATHETSLYPINVDGSVGQPIKLPHVVMELLTGPNGAIYAPSVDQDPETKAYSSYLTIIGADGAKPTTQVTDMQGQPIEALVSQGTSVVSGDGNIYMVLVGQASSEGYFLVVADHTGTVVRVDQDINDPAEGRMVVPDLGLGPDGQPRANGLFLLRPDGHGNTVVEIVRPDQPVTYRTLPGTLVAEDLVIEPGAMKVRTKTSDGQEYTTTLS